MTSRLNFLDYYLRYRNLKKGTRYLAFTCAINVLEDGTSTRSGHSMTVEGYTTLQGKTTGNTIRTLMVFDGWNEYVRYLNFDSEDFTELESTVFTYY